MELGNEFNGEGRANADTPWTGFVTQEAYARIDQENREDWELDQEILDLVQLQLEGDELGRYKLV